MTDPQPRRHFKLDGSAASDEAAEPASSLRQRETFAGTNESHPLAPLPEDKALPAASLGAPRKRRWGLLFALVGGAGLGTAELVTGIPDAMAQSQWLAIAWQLFGISLIGLGGVSLLKELGRLRRLKRHDKLRGDLAELPQRSPKQAQAMAEQLKRQLKLADDDPHWLAFQRASQPHHSGEEIQTLLRYHLLAPRDREAQRLITRMSGETAIMVALSPLTLVDMALVAWRSLAMVDRLCRLYGLELGYASRLRLFRNVLHNMAFAGASELATDASMDMLSLDLAGRLSARAGQGLATGLLSARLGLRAQRLCRPVPFSADEQPKIADLRQDLWRQIKRLDKEPSTTNRS
ncbi:TIGR01620 family protein [Halovibrio sp. HP20-50]|uniref:YcjF family protein n=1 Tax=Halovibrio sp. HP20-59 TaxID=3080275 RepID=UPI00294AF1F2|nr:TIGR01620 family protein [Halovibrio sp. HP20-59]MEA2118156.1 TIGR01620 family protein [Halovibrio sp. HP20-59]